MHTTHCVSALRVVSSPSLFPIGYRSTCSWRRASRHLLWVRYLASLDFTLYLRRKNTVSWIKEIYARSKRGKIYTELLWQRGHKWLVGGRGSGSHTYCYRVFQNFCFDSYPVTKWGFVTWFFNILIICHLNFPIYCSIIILEPLKFTQEISEKFSSCLSENSAHLHLMLLSKIVIVYSDHTKYVNRLWGQNAEFLYVEARFTYINHCAFTWVTKSVWSDRLTLICHYNWRSLLLYKM